MSDRIKFYINKIKINEIILLLAFISLLNNGILFSGLRIYIIIAFGFLFFNNFVLKKTFFNPLSIELYYFIILFFFIITIFPYEDHMEKSRSFTQRFEGRYISQFFRFLFEILTSSYFYFFYKKDKIKFNLILYIATIITILIGLVDILFLNKELYFYFIDNTSVGTRFTSLNIEPRMLGLALVYVYVYFSYMKFSNKKLFPIIVAIFLTISFSSIVFFLMSFLYFNKNKKLIIFSLICFVTIFLLFVLLPYASQFQLLYDRLNTVTTINSGEDYFSIFSIFEIFDRAALNALFNNKIYLYLGFGPNTISIPGSDYIPSFWYQTYEGMLNSPPHTGFVNILSRSGLFFLIYFTIIHLKQKKWYFFILYLLQYNFIFYSFYFIIFDKNDK